MVTEIVLGTEPQAAALANGLIWIAHASGEMRAYSPEGALLATVQIDPNPVGLATDGQRLWAAHRTGMISQIDATTGAITARWTLPCTRCLIRGIHWDGAFLWASDFASSTILRIDPLTGAIESFSAGADSPTAITSDAYGLLVLHQSLAETSVVLTRHDRATGAVIASLSEDSFPTAVLSAEDAVWLVLREEETGTLARLNARNLEELWRVEAAPVNNLLLVDGVLWSADFANNTVTGRNPQTGDVLQVFPAGSLPQALVYDRGFLWVVNRRSGTLNRYWVGP